MKSNVTLSSSDRELFGITIRQNTKEQFLSISDLQKAYEVARWQHGWSQQNISSLLSGDKIQERLYYLLSEANILKIEISLFKEVVKKEGITNVLKGLGVYKTTGRGSDKTVMASPYIWVLIAMELNPMIYAKVVKWLTDSLIFDRVEAGTEYLPMNSAIKSVVAIPDYPRYARAINEKVFGQHQTGMRNLASSKELRKISDIEKFIIQSIEFGFLRCENDILTSIKNFR